MTTPSVCPSCKKAASGNFCQECGTQLGGRFCNQCGGALGTDARFCNQCGAQAGAAAKPKVKGGGASRTSPPPMATDRRSVAAEVVGGQNLPWWIAGVALFGLIIVVGTQMVRPEGPSVPTGTVGAPATTAGTGAPPDISSMTPIEAADRLFNRVMQSASAGDSAGAQGFMPMAIAAYERAQPLNADGLFHLSLLQRTALDLEGSLLTAQRILEEDPNHLLGLSAAAEAAVELGRLDEAAAIYQQIVGVYDAEMDRGLSEYLDHAGITDNLKVDAEAFLAGR